MTIKLVVNTTHPFVHSPCFDASFRCLTMLPVATLIDEKIALRFRNTDCTLLYQYSPKFKRQVIKTFSMREGWWYIGIKGGGGVKSKGTRIVIEKEK